MNQKMDYEDLTPAKPVTLRTLAKMAAAGEKIPVLTCYDATTARWLARGGIPAFLVGDTAAEMILGYDQTLYAPLDFMITLTAAVKRGAPHTFVIGDMPFMSYHASSVLAMQNAGRFLTQGHADAVKLEVDLTHAPLVEQMSRAGIPVIAHLGSLPQHVRLTGGYRSAGKTAAEGRALVEQALAMQDAGAIMLLLEALTEPVSTRIVESVKIPVIGCGAGPACHGHVVVLHDLLGLTNWQPPFAQPYMQEGLSLMEAARHWKQLVQSGRYLEHHPYKMDDEQTRLFEQR